MITERQKKILKWIVEEYVRTAEPVGSKSMAELPEFGYSSATIRNEMAALEEMGLLVKTHTSSGRVPSELGYKLYVQDVIDSKEEKEDFPMIDEIFRRNDNSREQAVRESMSLVSELTNYAAVALGRGAYNERIRKLQLVKISDNYAVIVLVTSHGYVESKKILIPESVNYRDIEKVIVLLNECLYDCPISQIDKKLHETMMNDDLNRTVEYYDELASVFVRALSTMVKDKYFMSGQTNILEQPEFQDVKKARSFMRALEQQEVLKVINFNTNGITVKIGQDNEVKAMEDCTVITVPYESQSGERGAIAVIGPTRMEYQKVIPLLDYIAKYLNKL